MQTFVYIMWVPYISDHRKCLGKYLKCYTFSTMNSFTNYALGIYVSLSTGTVTTKLGNTLR